MLLLCTELPIARFEERALDRTAQASCGAGDLCIVFDGWPGIEADQSRAPIVALVFEAVSVGFSQELRYVVIADEVRRSRRGPLAGHSSFPQHL